APPLARASPSRPSRRVGQTPRVGLHIAGTGQSRQSTAHRLAALGHHRVGRLMCLEKFPQRRHGSRLHKLPDQPGDHFGIPDRLPMRGKLPRRHLPPLGPLQSIALRNQVRQQLQGPLPLKGQHQSERIGVPFHYQ
ncbi:MAG: hypothetical protein ACK56I_11585, partial [bacterium]